MPDLAVAPPAAPAAPAPSAPAPSSPAPVTPAVSAPTPVSTPAPEPTTVTPPATPATPTPTGTPQPKRADFADGIEGDKEFTAAHFKWQDEQPADAEPDIAPESPDQPAEPEVQAEEPPAEEQPAEPQDLPDEPTSLTPESLNTLLTANEALRTALEADPAAKGALFKMARENAKLAPIGELFPNVEAAKYADETARSTTEIRSGFLNAAEDPTQMAPAFDKFVDLFREYDGEGKPLMEADGVTPKLGKDFDMLANHMVTNYFDGQIGTLEEKLKTGKLSERAKETTETLLEAYKFIKNAEAADPSSFDEPDMSNASDEAKEWFQKQKEEIQRQREEAGLAEKKQTAQQRQAARLQHNTKVSQTVAGEFGGRLDEIVAEKKAANVNLPWFALQATDTDGVSLFAKSVYKQFLEKTVGHLDKATGKRVGGIAKVVNDFAMLESQPPSDDIAKQRVELFRQLREEYMPGIVEAEIRKMQKAERADRESRGKKVDAARANVQPEPRTGTAPKPSAMTPEKAMEQAQAEAAKEGEGKFLSDADLYELTMKKYLRLTS